MTRRSLQISVVTWLVLSCPFVYSQQADFFWSLSDLNSGAVNGPLEVSVQPGDTLSLFLYYSTNGPSDQDLDAGALLDIATSQDAVIRFIDAESFDFPITVQDIEIGYRWTPPKSCGGAGKLGMVTDFFINEWGAFGLFGDGIRDNNTNTPVLDEGYDIAADAFLFGRINIEVVGEIDQCVQIQIGPGNGGIAFDSGFPEFGSLFEPAFGSALITIGDVILGDTNNDLSVDLLDVASFVELLVELQYSVAADINCDGLLSLIDVQPFVDLLTGVGLKVTDPSIEDDRPQSKLLGDVNNDGFINLRDIPCFQALGIDCPHIVNADINGDGVVDLLDACPFVELLLSIE